MITYGWDDLHEGMAHTFEVELTPEMMDAFRGLSGDTNPLHSEPAYARECGFPSAVAFGLLTTSLYSRLVGVYLPGKLSLFHGLDVDFVSPAFVGDRLTVSGEVRHLTAAYRRVDIGARITKNTGELVSRAKLRVGLRER
jgi:3-hydroxybutyryl-CoA dehydratase